jgi:hypothetical protein
MDIAIIRNAMITQMQGNAALTAEIAADKIGYGMPRNIGTSLLPRSIRVIQLGRGSSPDGQGRAEVMGGFGGGIQKVWASYIFHVVCVFGLDDTDDEKDAEDLEALLDKLIRQALTSDYTLGGTVTDITLGRTIPLTHVEKDDIRMIVIEVGARTYERADAR